MSSELLLPAGGILGAAKQFVDDVFSTYLYTGTGNPIGLNTGTNLADNGGMIWFKNRSVASPHKLVNTEQSNFSLDSSASNSAVSDFGAAGNFFSNIGFELLGAPAYNTNGQNYSSWSFRRARKFFDVVTYTGDGNVNRRIPHNLGALPGLVVIKSVDVTLNWIAAAYNGSTGHAIGSAASDFGFNLTNAAGSIGALSNNFFTSNDIALRGMLTDADVNASQLQKVNEAGFVYVAYLWAHDPDPVDGIIQCGSVLLDASGNATVNLGWEPQWILTKPLNGVASPWAVRDNLRGFTVAATSQLLAPNTTAAEAASATFRLSGQGFSIVGGGAQNTQVFYAAIRRPNKPPTLGAQVFSAVARPGTGAATEVPVGLTADVAMISRRETTTSTKFVLIDRLRGQPFIGTSITTAETTTAATIPALPFDSNTSFGVGTNSNTNLSGGTYIDYAFRRAPGFMDVVAYTGTDAADAKPHGLQAIPELILIKARNAAQNWSVGGSVVGGGNSMVLNTTAARAAAATVFPATANTATAFNVGTSLLVNSSGSDYIAYLFASLAGVSRVGSYVGNGGSQAIPCGFSGGARFVMIKRMNAVGDWYVWDTARGIVAGNDPHLSLNGNLAEVTTDDTIDLNIAGFIVNQVAATNMNVSGSTYLFLAIAGAPQDPNAGEQSFTTPGTFNFVVPAGVTSVSAVAVAGGGGGSGGSSGGDTGGAGAGGGGTSFTNGISVTPGESLTVIVGAGGLRGNADSNGSAGGDSSILRSSSVLVTAQGGKPSVGGVGGGEGGFGSAGNGGSGEGINTNSIGSGGGGAGGYSGAGGKGGRIGTPAQAGQGGGGGGGASGNDLFQTGGGGGGVGLLGQGLNGSAGLQGVAGSGGGGGGSGGQNGDDVGNGGLPAAGGQFGGGGGGGAQGNNQGGVGSIGAVRIIWGQGRSFPFNAGPLLS